jgi:hypothetical protein
MRIGMPPPDYWLDVPCAPIFELLLEGKNTSNTTRGAHVLLPHVELCLEAAWNSENALCLGALHVVADQIQP